MNTEVGLRQTEEDTEGEQRTESNIMITSVLCDVQVPAPLEHIAAWVLPD